MHRLSRILADENGKISNNWPLSRVIMYSLYSWYSLYSACTGHVQCGLTIDLHFLLLSISSQNKPRLQNSISQSVSVCKSLQSRNRKRKSKLGDIEQFCDYLLLFYTFDTAHRFVEKQFIQFTCCNHLFIFLSIALQ